jgi:hypothetical protein
VHLTAGHPSHYGHRNGEWGYPEDPSLAASDDRIEPLHLRYLLDLRNCVALVLDRPRPDVVAELDRRIADMAGYFKGFTWFKAPSMIAQAEEAIAIARKHGYWDHEAFAVVCELCNVDRLMDLFAADLERDFCMSTVRQAIDILHRIYGRVYR